MTHGCILGNLSRAPTHMEEVKEEEQDNPPPSLLPSSTTPTPPSSSSSSSSSSASNSALAGGSFSTNKAAHTPPVAMLDPTPSELSLDLNGSIPHDQSAPVAVDHTEDHDSEASTPQMSRANGANEQQPAMDHTQKTPLAPYPQLSSTSTTVSPSRSIIVNQRYSTPLGGFTVGYALSKHTVLLWLFCCLIPICYLLIMFGAIPIGERRDDDGDTDRFHHYWVFTCVVNPINMTVIAFLNCGIFLSCMGVMRPFRVHWIILVSVFVVQIFVFNLIVPFKGTFDFFGVASLFLCYGTTFLSIYYYETWKVKKQCFSSGLDLKQDLSILHKNFFQYVKVACAFLVFYLVLLLYIWAYQHVGKGLGQKLVPFGMTIGVFIIRKVMLALTDHFPLDTAMLISGFWVENIYDMFQTMAYRQVKLPVNYVSVWLTNALSILANLVFLTEAYLPRMFKGQCCPYKLGIEPDESEDDNERGHSNNRTGYHRRQCRFFMYKVFSKCIAACFYFLISTILRYGVNRKLFPFHQDSFEEYQNSLQFCCYNLIFLVVAGIGAAIFVRTKHRKVFDHFLEARTTLTSRHMLGSLVALLIHNGIIAISMIMYFNQVYYVVHDD